MENRGRNIFYVLILDMFKMWFWGLGKLFFILLEKFLEVIIDF